MLLRSLPIAALAASLAAQPVLQYDNGPLETQSQPGFSDLQFAAPFGLNIYGYGAQLAGTTDNSVFDDFEVAGAMIIDEVVFYCYQTGAGSGPSTITGCSVAFYDSDPSQQAPLTEMVGSPLFSTDQFSTPNNPVSNAWSGLYRTLDGNMATNRAIMEVRIKLEDAAGNATPLVLTNGRYWIRLQASGSAASGPWFPPVTCENQIKTGDAMQFIGATSVFNNPIVSGGQGQAIPFQLWGNGSTPGSITEVATNNHGLTLSVCGSPNTGGFFRAELSGNDPAALPIIGFDFSANVTQVCNSNFVHAFPISILLATDAVVDIPLGLFGVTIGVQAAELTVPPVAPGACFGSANISNGFAVVINT